MLFLQFESFAIRAASTTDYIKKQLGNTIQKKRQKQQQQNQQDSSGPLKSPPQGAQQKQTQATVISQIDPRNQSELFSSFDC
jgi:hypothetical protein